MLPYLLAAAGGYLLGNSWRESFANGGMISWVDEKDKYTKYWGRKPDSVGSFYIKGHRDDSYLYPLSDFDKEYWKDVKLKPNERLFRYRSATTDVANISPVVKINIDKSLIYFLQDLDSDDDKNLVFETRGIKPQYISLHKDILTQYKHGGETNGIDRETYQKWKSLVNMSKSELKAFYDSEEGKEAGLSAGEAKELGIDSGRESARWIMKMKDTPVSEWTPTMWKWAKKQISFVSRMKGNKGKLYDENGKKTRKHTSLLIWGHNPEK